MYELEIIHKDKNEDSTWLTHEYKVCRIDALNCELADIIVLAIKRLHNKHFLKNTMIKIIITSAGCEESFLRARQ